VYEVRKRLGAQLAKEHPVKADFVMAIPDSGNYAATGFAQQLGMPLEIGFIRNHYIGRTFIQPTQFLRDFRVRVKLNPISHLIKGKRSSWSKIPLFAGRHPKAVSTSSGTPARKRSICVSAVRRSSRRVFMGSISE